jgi:poly-gamma-glutamate capsule biosynthesis protein CapA/YwtB (metallophosphatase superfamily)
MKSRELPLRVFLSGDVMTGRGIDQILPHACDPRIYEPVMSSAEGYVRLAEKANGAIARPVNFEYIWGAALEELKDGGADAYLVNLETSITRCCDFLPKGINYRMSPENAGCLLAAGVDCCVLANNHVLDWGHHGLVETLATLEKLGIRTAGAGRNLFQARMSAVLKVRTNRRVVVFALASLTSGTPKDWAAEESAAGVNLLLDLSDENAIEIAHQVAQIKRAGDIVIISIHWGPNWGYHIPEEQRRFAHKLIEEADASAVFGHSSHHAKAIEIYRDRLILYGCGDFLNDYEGIAGYEKYRDDLVLLYAATFDGTGAELIGLELIPFQIRRLQLIRPSDEDVAWLQQRLERESRRFGVSVRIQPNGKLAVSWARENTLGQPFSY